MNIVCKYSLLLLLMANIASQYVLFNPVSNVLFYGVLGLAAVNSIFSITTFFNIDNIRATSFLWLFIAIYILYQLTFGANYLERTSIEYVIAKVFVLIIIYWGVTTNFDFYYKTLVPFLSIAIALLIVYGYLFNNEVFSGRMTCGFGNPNSTSAVSFIAFAGFLLMDIKPKLLKYIGAAVCLFGLLAGGSRAAIAVCMLAIFLKYEFSFKTMMLFGICVIVVLFLFPFMGFEVAGIYRVFDVVDSGNFVGSRGNVRKATFMMIAERPITGWGLKTGIQGAALKISTLGSHNGYYDTIKAIGIPFAVVLFGGALKILFGIRQVIKSKIPEVRYHMFVTGSVLLAACFESYIIGVNQIITNLLFVSVAILQYRCYYNLEEEGFE